MTVVKLLIDCIIAHSLCIWFIEGKGERSIRSRLGLGEHVQGRIRWVAWLN